MTKRLFYVAAVSNHASRDRGSPWIWSAPFDTAAEAKEQARKWWGEGTITIAFVVQMDGEGKRVLVGKTWPTTMAGPIERYLELLDLLKS